MILTHHRDIFLYRSKNVSQNGSTHCVGDKLSSLCEAAGPAGSSEVHPEHLHPDRSCVNKVAHATGSSDTDIYHWITQDRDKVNNKILMGTESDCELLIFSWLSCICYQFISIIYKSNSLNLPSHV